MDLKVNNDLVFVYYSSQSHSTKQFSENITISWGINALCRYWHSPDPTKFRYRKALEAPITKEEENEW